MVVKNESERDFLTVVEGSALWLKMRKSFKLFVWYYFTNYHNLPTPTWIQAEMCDLIQNSEEDLCCEFYRACGKSLILGLYVVWRLWTSENINEENILVVSATSKRAKMFSSFCQQVIKNVPFLNYLDPSGRDKSILWTKDSFSVFGTTLNQFPNVMSGGINTQITGMRANLIICDDVEIPQNSATVEQREKLWQSTRELEPLRKPKTKSRIIYLGTPQSEETIYDMLGDIGYRVVVYPAKYPDKVENYRGYLAPSLAFNLREDPSLVGKYTDPDRFALGELEQLEVTLGKRNFQLQMMLDSTLSDAQRYPLKLRDVIVMPVGKTHAPIMVHYGCSKDLEYKDLPHLGFRDDKYHHPLKIDTSRMLPFEHSIIAIDPAGTGTDETTYCIVKFLNGYAYLVDWGGIKQHYRNLENKQDDNLFITLGNKMIQHNVRTAVIETNFGDGAWTELFKMVLRQMNFYPEIVDVRQTKNKESRIINALEPMLLQHKLIIDPEVIRSDYETSVLDRTTLVADSKVYSGIYQLTHITREKRCLTHDDRVDVLAIALDHYAELIAKQSDKGKQEEEARLKQEEMNKWFVGAIPVDKMMRDNLLKGTTQNFLGIHSRWNK